MYQNGTTKSVTDARAVLRIYQAGIDSGNASFESTAPSWDAFDAGKLTDHRYVAVDSTDTVLGWVTVSAVSSRCVYAGVVEHSVYVDPACRRRGVGHTLLDTLIRSTEAAGIWTIQSGIFPETPPASPCTNGPASASSASARRLAANARAMSTAILLTRLPLLGEGRVTFGHTQDRGGIMRLSFVGITPVTPTNECPAVFVDEDTGEFWFQGETVTDPAALAEIAGHSPIGANESVVKLPPVMAAIILEAVSGMYERGRRGPGVHGVDDAA